MTMEGASSSPIPKCLVQSRRSLGKTIDKRCHGHALVMCVPVRSPHGRFFEFGSDFDQDC